MTTDTFNHPEQKTGDARDMGGRRSSSRAMRLRLVMYYLALALLSTCANRDCTRASADEVRGGIYDQCATGRSVQWVAIGS